MPSVMEDVDTEMRQRTRRERPDIDLDIITDVSKYAHVYGIKQDCYISPQVLKDIKDLPDGYEEKGEIDRSRLNMILSIVRREFDDPHENIINSIALLDRKHKPKDEYYYPLTTVIKDGYILISKTNETIENSDALVKEINQLRSTLHPPTLYRYGNSLLN